MKPRCTATSRSGRRCFYVDGHKHPWHAAELGGYVVEQWPRDHNLAGTIPPDGNPSEVWVNPNAVYVEGRRGP